MAAHLKAGRSLVHEDAGDALRFRFFRIGAREHAEHRAVLGVRDKHLGAIHHPLVVLAHSARLESGGVRTRTRLGERHARVPLAGGHFRQVGLFLLVRPVVQNHPGGHHVRTQDARHAHPPHGQLLHGDGVANLVHAASAIFLGYRKTEKPEFLHLLHGGRGVFVGEFVFHGDGDDLAIHEILHHPLNAHLQFGELEIQGMFPPEIKWPEFPPGIKSRLRGARSAVSSGE